MKIKTKKTMNLPQLIEWAWENPKEVESKIFESDNIDYFSNTAHVQFSNDGYGVRMNSSVSVDDTFTVEDEEEITLTTSLPSMLHVWKTEVLGTEMKEVKNKSIASQYTVCSTEFWLKEDNEMTLIWKDGKMVE